MQIPVGPEPTQTNTSNGWRLGSLILVPLFALIAVHLIERIPQDSSYHRLADTRSVFGVPNFWNVFSNIAFLILGIIGLRFCLGISQRNARTTWAIFFGGVALVSIASGYYHLTPNDATLVWDRLPMTVAFMALFAAVLNEHTGERFSWHLLAPAIAIGIASLVWWRYTDDLRLYIWVQAAPLITIPIALALFPARYSHRQYLLYGLAFYLLAKLAEHYDAAIYQLTAQAISGHSLKHLLAATSALWVYLMLKRRSTPIAS